MLESAYECISRSHTSRSLRHPQQAIALRRPPPSMSAPNQRVLAGTTTTRVRTMRPPAAPGRPAASRAQTATPTFGARASSRASSRERTPKRAAQSEIDLSSLGGEETNINVVVRCRGRNDREVRENSGVVVSTNGVKGTQVELSMGPSALSNKTYQFDKVFSPAADQNMVFEEVVAPILDEVSWMMCGIATNSC
jgi:kinesin family protein 11